MSGDHPSRKQFLVRCARLAACGGLALLGQPLAGCNGRGARPAGIRLNARAAAIDPNFEPGYLRQHRAGELRTRADELWGRMSRCRLCPRECGAARTAGDRGACGASAELRIASYHPHFGEERPLVGLGGSGTIFFSHCNLAACSASTGPSITKARATPSTWNSWRR